MARDESTSHQDTSWTWTLGKIALGGLSLFGAGVAADELFDLDLFGRDTIGSVTESAHESGVEVSEALADGPLVGHLQGYEDLVREVAGNLPAGHGLREPLIQEADWIKEKIEALENIDPSTSISEINQLLEQLSEERMAKIESLVEAATAVEDYASTPLGATDYNTPFEGLNRLSEWFSPSSTAELEQHNASKFSSVIPDAMERLQGALSEAQTTARDATGMDWMRLAGGAGMTAGGVAGFNLLSEAESRQNAKQSFVERVGRQPTIAQNGAVEYVRQREAAAGPQLPYQAR